MSGAFAYSGLTTKIRAMHGNLISKEDYSTLANLTSVTEVIQFLQKHPAYSNTLPGNVDESFYHRGKLEQYLTLSLYNDFAKIYNFATLSQRKYMQLCFLTYETRFLKQLFRELTNDGRITSDFSVLAPFYDKFTSIDFDKVVHSSSIGDLIDNQKNTAYYEPLSKVADITSPTLFDYELCLDLHKYTIFWKKKKKYLSGIDLKVTTDAYGFKIDLLNIQWIYRCHKYYNMTSPQIYALVIPISHHLKFHELKSLVEADNIQDFMDRLSGTYYGNYIPDLDNGSIEKYFESLMLRQYKKLFRNSPYSLACVNTYLYLRELEIEKIIKITECIRYSYSPDVILQIISTDMEN